MLPCNFKLIFYLTTHCGVIHDLSTRLGINSRLFPHLKQSFEIKYFLVFNFLILSSDLELHIDDVELAYTKQPFDSELSLLISTLTICDRTQQFQDESYMMATSFPFGIVLYIVRCIVLYIVRCIVLYSTL